MAEVSLDCEDMDLTAVELAAVRPLETARKANTGMVPNLPSIFYDRVEVT